MMPLLLLLLTAFSCKKPLFDTASREAATAGRASPTRETSEPEGRFYATAIVFPDTVDWRQGHSHDAKVVLWRDGKPVGSVPVGDKADPDKHLFQNGHLWTWDTTPSITSVYCDGSPAFGLLGEETFVGFLVADGAVHTLGQRAGGGFSYCVDGQTVFSSPTGVVLGQLDDPDWEGGALCADATGVYYAYGFPVQLPAGPVWEYRVMKGGELISLLPALAGGEMYDIRVREGVIYRLEERYGTMCLLKGEELTALSLPEDSRAPHLVWADGAMQVKGYDEQVSARYPSYRLYTHRCQVQRDGSVALALTSEASDEHLLVVDDEEISARFNGFFTGIYLQ